MKYIKKYKKQIIIIAIILFVLLCAYSIWTMLPNSSKSLYGDRLDGIDVVEIDKSTLKKITKDLKQEQGVVKVNADIKGRLINFNVNVKKDIVTSIGNTLTPIILAGFSKDEKNFYDLQIFITGDDEQYSLIGYKHKTSKEFVWSNNK
ncbi:MAG: hypothetical protein RR847_00775 [Bacilli bacterium]